MRALGVDVGGPKKGLDVVALDDDLGVVRSRARVAVEDLAAVIDDVEPDVIAIDSPPGPALRGTSRQAERDLARLGIHSYATPSDPARFDRPFYGWMKVGFDAFGVAAPRFPRYGSGEVRRTAIEVFPHATAVVLTGCLPAATASKGRWRRGVLESHGVSAGALRSVDQIDATLAALTGLIALRGEFCSVGDPHEGVIVLPVRESALMRPAYRRCRSKAPTLAQPTLPGMSRCVCGDPSCLRSTNGEFAPGHDGKRKSILWRQVRAGDEAVRELVARGWQLPPEMQPRT